MAEDGVPRCAPLPSSNLVPDGRVAARERQGALTVKFSIGWVRTRFGEGGGQLDRRQARGGLNPCARESKARTGRFLGEKLMSDLDHFSSYEGHKEQRTGKIHGAFSRMLLGCGSFVRGRKRKKGDSLPFILSRRDYM